MAESSPTEHFGSIKVAVAENDERLALEPFITDQKKKSFFTILYWKQILFTLLQ
jgi:hypothetical protein